VHGFINAYLATGEEQFADVAAACLRFWGEHAALDELPPYDMLAETGLFDASAAAILASGLAEAVSHPPLAKRLDATRRLGQVLGALERDALFAGPAGIIGRSTYSAPHGWGVDGALPYGDYFYLRALVTSQ
jgi:unsaturated chondroitin disaccharide hydrolase